jgi:hypothetical protein
VIAACPPFFLLLQQWWKVAPAMDAKAMFNLFLEFSRQLSDSSGSGNIASAGDFEKFNMLMKSNKEGATVDDLPEGPVSQDGNHSEHEMHEQSPDPMQADNSSGKSTRDSSSDEGGMYTCLQEFV